MSHFSCLVVGDNPEQQLEPFWELDLDLEELRKDHRAVFRVIIEEGELEKNYNKWRDEYILKLNKAIGELEGLKSQKTPDLSLIESTKTDIKNYEHYLEDYRDPMDWVSKWYGYSYEEKKGWGYWENPNAKWDWFQLGGRWRGYFKLKLNSGVDTTLGEMGSFGNESKYDADQAVKKDIDFYNMRIGNFEEASRLWEEAWKNYPEEDKSVRRYLEYGITKEDTKESYLKRQTSIATHAVLMDGKWYQRGEMGWWGHISNEKDLDVWEKEFNELLDNLPDDTLLSVYDLHI